MIYLRRGIIAQLQPNEEEEYRDIHLTRLLDPQDTSGRPDLYQWLQTDEIQDGVLVVAQGKRLVKRIARRSYAVRQITGVALGYEIHDQATTDLERLRERRLDFQNYPVDTRALPTSFKVHLENADGLLVPQSASGACGSSQQRTLVGGPALCTSSAGTGWGKFPPPICATSARSGMI